MNLPDHAIEVSQLTKIYRAKGSGKASPSSSDNSQATATNGKLALDKVDLVVPRGSIFALLGPNGAGKSTLINILAGLVIKTSGEARVWGYDGNQDMRQARLAIGVVPQELNIDPFFTPFELLEMQAGLYGVPKSERDTDKILQMVGLYDKRNSYARALSGGMRRRLLVAKALVHRPPVLVLDEPTAGVDIELRRQLWDNVQELNRQGTTVLLTTHYLEEAEQLCEHIAIINHGKLVANESKRSLLGRLDVKTMRMKLAGKLDNIPASLANFQTNLSEDKDTGLSILDISYKPSLTKASDVVQAIAASGLEMRDLTTVETDLEDIFLQITRNS